MNIAIGRNTRVLHEKCILIGDNLVSDHPYQLTIRTDGVFLNDTMTYQEWERIQGGLSDFIARIGEDHPHKQGGENDRTSPGT